MNNRILLCTDLDRTLLPNGDQPESDQARPAFVRLARHPELSLAYVTGRHRQLVLEAIRQYQLPQPHYVIGDVGSSLYIVNDGKWQIEDSWRQTISHDWQGLSHDDLANLFGDIIELQLQEAEKQHPFKLSYYAPPDITADELMARMNQRLAERDVQANLIWSIDEQLGRGLLDVLPRSASKLHAIEFLMQLKGYAHDRTVFSGDSGNDLMVLGSHINAVLVANASDEVRNEALRLAKANGSENALYLAHGDWMDMNGNYSAGILEGLAHFLPETRSWL